MGKPKLKIRDIKEIYSGLIRLLDAGSKPIEALRRLSLGEGIGRARPLFAAAADLMEEGDSLAAALEKAGPGVFPHRDLATLEAAGITGAWSGALRRLVAAHDRQQALAERLKKKMAYPALLVHVALAVAVVFLFIGKVTLLTGIGFTLIIIPFYAVLLTVWNIYTGYKNDPDARNRLLGSSYMGRFIRESELGEFFSLLHTLYAAGVRLDDAATRASSMIGTPFLEAIVMNALKPLNEGESFTACLKEIGLPDDAFAQRLSIGEETGNLEEALKETGEELLENAQKRIASLLTRISILITSLAYIGVGLIVIGYWADYYGTIPNL